MRKEKQLLLDQIKDKIENSNALIVARYQSMNANGNADFRKSIRDAGGDFEIIRKRVLKKAVEASDLSINLDYEGHIGLIFALEDPVAVTKSAFDYAKANAKTLEFLTGQFEGQIVSEDELKDIAKLPGKDQMRSELLGLFEAPMSQTLSVVESLLTSVVHCLNNKAEKE